MNESGVGSGRGRADWSPQVSLVLPCYNEQACLGETAPAIVEAFRADRIDLELVLVDNGSTDRTGAIIDGFIADGLPVTKVSVPVNRGYGHGIIQGLQACRAQMIGYLCADGQVAPEDVVRSYRLMAHREERVLAKVRRRFRQDSWKRKVVSVIYNGLMLSVFGWLGAIDINGSPKLFSKDSFQAMRLRSDDWFLDPEIILKARALGLRIIEIDVEGYARHGGASHVRRQTMWEFLKNIWRYRTGRYMREWRREAEHFRRAHFATALPSRAPRFDAPADSPTRGGAPPVGVRVLAQARHEDVRGFLQKILTASQCEGRVPQGEVYVTAARPGEAKGNHFHRQMGEWFAVVQGRGALYLQDPETGARREIEMSASEPRTVYVPPRLAHAVVNTGDGTLICVAWAEGEHDPTDVFPLAVWPPTAVSALPSPAGSSIPVRAG